MAAVGAVVLAFVAVFIVRAVWWNPTSGHVADHVGADGDAPGDKRADTATSWPETTGGQENPEANPDAERGRQST